MLNNLKIGEGYMFSDNNEVKASTEIQSTRLPTLVFLEQHENPHLQNFYNEILPALKKRGYKKFLSESFPNRQLGTEYFDTELAACSQHLESMETSLRKFNKLETYNALPTSAARFEFCIAHRMPVDTATQCATLPNDIRNLKFYKKIISNFGFHFFGTEDATTKEYLRDVYGSLTDTFAISQRDKLNASELIKHHHAIQEGGVLMSVGLSHFPGLRHHLIQSAAQSNDYLFIYLTNDLDDPHPVPANIIAKSCEYKTFKLIQIPLDSSKTGGPDTAAREVLSLAKLLSPNMQTHPMPRTGTGHMTALKLATILNNHTIPDIKVSLEIAFNLTKLSNDAATKIQALARGRLTRKNVSPLLRQFKQAQVTLQSAGSQECELRKRIIAAANSKQYAAIIGLPEQAMMCQKTSHATKHHIQTLKQTAKGSIKK
jgi:hypothetical protein